MIALVEFELSVGAFRGRLSFALPFLFLEPILYELSAEQFYFPKKDARRTPQPLDRFSEIQLPSSLYYDGGELSLSELSSLKKGDLVPLDASEAPLVFELGGRPLLRMKEPGRRGYAVAESSLDIEAFGGEGRREKAAAAGDDGQDEGALSRIASEMNAAFSRLERKLEELTARQNELADQVFFGEEGQIGKNGETAGRPLAFAADLDRGRLARFLSGERPQTTALVLSCLDPAPAGDLLSRLGEEGQEEVVRRIARIGAASPILIAELSACLRRRQELSRAERFGVLGGADLLAAMAAGTASRKTAAIIAEVLAANGPPTKADRDTAIEKPGRA
jgi:hypothetical protein